MALTDDPSLINQKIIDLLDAEKEDLGLVKIYYGDQGQIPEYPAACVEWLSTNRIIRETGKPEAEIRNGIIIYFGKIQSSEINIKESQEIAQLVTVEMHRHRTLDGLVVHGFVERADPGVALNSAGEFVKATRLTWYSRTKVLFPV